MKRVIISIYAVALFLISIQAYAQRSKKDKLETEVDSLSYAIGISFANSIKTQDIPELNIDKITMALENLINENEPKMTVQEAQKFIQTYLTGLKEKQKQENLIKANEFLEDNMKKDGVHVLPSGLQYKIIKEGIGVSPTLANKVKTHYKGTLLDGTEFDSSYERGEPIEFKLGGVIKGWQEALKLMKPGSKWILYIHPDLGYGERGTGPIPANSLLIFEIELLSVE